MSIIKIHEQLTQLRKQKKLTQEELARVFGVTNQSVSKWESGACCPDISLLPDIADFFGVSMDALFGITPEPKGQTVCVESVPWDDDDTVRAVVFLGQKILSNLEDLRNFTFVMQGEAKDVECRCNLTCGYIQGNANAGCDIHCGERNQSNGLGIGGRATAGRDINSGFISGQATAGCDINSGHISGGAGAGCDIHCGSIEGGISTANQINCASIHGETIRAATIKCETIQGPVTCGENITCHAIHGDVDCKGEIIYCP